MNRFAALSLLVLALLCTPAAAMAQSSSTAKIVVQVNDQNGLAYSGVSVTIYSTSGSGTSIGTTANGVFVSSPLTTYETYVVLVSSGTSSASTTVSLGGTDTYVKLVLNRPPPLRPRLVIADVSYNPSTVVPGAGFAVQITINNTGTGTAYAGTVTVVPGSGINLVGSTGTQATGDLDQNKTSLVTFQMTANSALPSGYVPVHTTISYTDIAGTTYNDSSSFNIQVVSRPDVRVGTFALSVAPLRPGVSSVLTLSLINVGGDRAYQVSLGLTGPVFVSGEETNYLGSIAAGSSASASFFLTVANDTAMGNYDLSLNINYTDAVGVPYTSPTTYAINVEPFVPPAVSVTNVLLDPPILTTGSQGTVTIFLKNAGSTTANDVQVSIANGNGIITSNYFGVGTMEPGDAVTQVVGLKVDSGLRPQSRTLQITVTYTDANGRQYSSSVPYQTQVFQAENLFSLFNLAVAAAAVLVVLGILFAIKKYELLKPFGLQI